MSSDKSWSVYRETLHQTSTPLIPYLGVYLSDLVFIETGNSDWWDGSNLVNFKKCRFIAKVITVCIYVYHFTRTLQKVQ